MDSIVTEKIREQILSDYNDDKFNYFALAGHLLNYINSQQFPISVGIYGKWGSGKSVLVKFIQEISNKQYKESIKFISIDAVRFMNSGDNLMELIIAEIANKLVGVQNLKTRVKGLSKLLSYFEQTKGLGKIIDNFLSNEKIINQMIMQINGTVEKKKNIKYFVIIENLDRMEPNDTIKFLEKLKLFFLNDSQKKLTNFAYIIPCDFDILKNEVNRIYGKHIDVRDYLNKLIEIPFYIPTYDLHSSKLFIKSLLNPALPLNVQDTIIDVLHFINVNTPREIKNYLLELDMLFIVSKFRNNDEKYLVRFLPKMLALQILKVKYNNLFMFIRDKYSLLKEMERVDSKRLVGYLFLYSYPNTVQDWSRDDGFQKRIEDIVGITEMQKLRDSVNFLIKFLDIAGFLTKGQDPRKFTNDVDWILHFIDSSNGNVNVNIEEEIKIG